MKNFEYKFKKVLKTLYEDVREGFIYSVEAFDEYGDIVNVKMNQEEIDEGGIYERE